MTYNCLICVDTTRWIYVVSTIKQNVLSIKCTRLQKYTVANIKGLVQWILVAEQYVRQYSVLFVLIHEIIMQPTDIENESLS